MNKIESTVKVLRQVDARGRSSTNRHVTALL